MQRNFSETVIVLDLDDTIYKEAEYRTSGLNEVCRLINLLYGKDLSNEITALSREGKGDILGDICRLAGLPDTVKESFLWVYRIHSPKIILSPEVQAVIKKLEEHFKAVAILSDGRSFSQRQKLKALGLTHLPAYISEEFGSTKPDTLRFVKIMEDFPAQTYVYVGDNPEKDFIAPRKLNWRTVGLRGDDTNIHSQDCDCFPEENSPEIWIESLTNLLELLR